MYRHVACHNPFRAHSHLGKEGRLSLFQGPRDQRVSEVTATRLGSRPRGPAFRAPVVGLSAFSLVGVGVACDPRDPARGACSWEPDRPGPAGHVRVAPPTPRLWGAGPEREGRAGRSCPASGEELKGVAGLSSRSASTPASRTRWWKTVGAHSTASPSLREPATATTSSTPTGVSAPTRPGAPREPARPGPGRPLWLPARGAVRGGQDGCSLTQLGLDHALRGRPRATARPVPRAPPALGGRGLASALHRTGRQGPERFRDVPRSHGQGAADLGPERGPQPRPPPWSPQHPGPTSQRSVFPKKLCVRTHVCVCVCVQVCTCVCACAHICVCVHVCM